MYLYVYIYKDIMVFCGVSFLLHVELVDCKISYGRFVLATRLKSCTHEFCRATRLGVKELESPGVTTASASFMQASGELMVISEAVSKRGGGDGDVDRVKVLLAVLSGYVVMCLLRDVRSMWAGVRFCRRCCGRRATYASTASQTDDIFNTTGTIWIATATGQRYHREKTCPGLNAASHVASRDPCSHCARLGRCQ